MQIVCYSRSEIPSKRPMSRLRLRIYRSLLTPLTFRPIEKWRPTRFHRYVVAEAIRTALSLYVPVEAIGSGCRPSTASEGKRR